METKKKSSTQLWLGIGVSILCLAAIFFFIEPTLIWQALKSANYGYLLLTALGIFVSLFFRAWRWRFMLENEVPYAPVFHIQNIGYLVNNFLPLRLGDVAQAVLIGSVPPITIARGLSSMVMARILDMMFVVLLLPVTLARADTVAPEVRAIAQATGMLIALLIIVLIIAANKRPFVSKVATILLTKTTSIAGKLAKWSEKKATHSRLSSFYKIVTFVFSGLAKLDSKTWVRRIDDLLVGLSSLTHLKSGLILILSTIFIWIPVISAYYAGMVAVHLEPTWATAGFVLCAAALSIAAPSSPGQIGVFHAGVTFALANILGQPEAQSASFAFLYHAINIIVMTIMGIIGLLATGATFRHVIETTRQYVSKRDENLSQPPNQSV